MWRCLGARRGRRLFSFYPNIARFSSPSSPSSPSLTPSSPPSSLSVGSNPLKEVLQLDQSLSKRTATINLQESPHYQLIFPGGRRSYVLGKPDWRLGAQKNGWGSKEWRRLKRWKRRLKGGQERLKGQTSSKSCSLLWVLVGQSDSSGTSKHVNSIWQGFNMNSCAMPCMAS